MEEGVLSLKWNNHSSSFINCLSSLHQNELYSDVTLACDGQFFAVHKLVLSVCSDYFDEILRKTTCTKPVIVLNDLKYSDLQALLNYMYVGEANIPQSDLSRLIKAAESLRIKGLAVPDENSHYKDKKRPTSDYNKEEESLSKKRKTSDIHTSIGNHHSFSDIERLSDSDAEVLDVRESRSTILHHATLRTPTLHTIDDGSNSPQPLATQVILHHHPLPEHHITLRHHSMKHSTQINRNQLHEGIIIPHHMPESSNDGGIKEESADESSGAERMGGNIERLGGGIDRHGGGMERHGGGVSRVVSGENNSSNAVVITETNQRNGNETSSVTGNSHSVSSVSSGALMHDLLSIPATSQHQETLVTWDGSSATITGYTLEGIIPEELRHQVTNQSAIQSSNHLPGTVTISEGTEASLITPTAMACSFCPRAFMYKSDLQRHVRTHTGERPYTCTQCTYKASQKSHLLEHMKRKHRQNVSPATGLVVPPGTILMSGVSGSNTSPSVTPSSSSSGHAQLLYTVTSNAINSQPTTLLYSTNIHSASPPPHQPSHQPPLHQPHVSSSQAHHSTSSAAVSVSSQHHVTPNSIEQSSSMGSTISSSHSILNTALNSYSTNGGNHQHSSAVNVANSSA